MSTTKNPRAIATNFAAKHGADGLDTLLTMLTNNVSGEAIGARFNLTRQRIDQLARIGFRRRRQQGTGFRNLALDSV